MYIRMTSLSGFSFSVSGFQIRVLAAGFKHVQDLAGHLGINRVLMSYYARGALPSAAVQERIAEALKCSPSDLWVPTTLTSST